MVDIYNKSYYEREMYAPQRSHNRCVCGSATSLPLPNPAFGWTSHTPQPLSEIGGVWLMNIRMKNKKKHPEHKEVKICQTIIK